MLQLIMTITGSDATIELKGEKVNKDELVVSAYYYSMFEFFKGDAYNLTIEQFEAMSVIGSAFISDILDHPVEDEK